MKAAPAIAGRAARGNSKSGKVGKGYKAGSEIYIHSAKKQERAAPNFLAKWEKAAKMDLQMLAAVADRLTWLPGFSIKSGKI